MREGEVAGHKKTDKNKGLRTRSLTVKSHFEDDRLEISVTPRGSQEW